MPSGPNTMLLFALTIFVGLVLGSSFPFSRKGGPARWSMIRRERMRNHLGDCIDTKAPSERRQQILGPRGRWHFVWIGAMKSAKPRLFAEPDPAHSL